MAITVGLDFGTHQTKICIENSDDPLHKTYEFFQWDDDSYTLPSIIQINKDHTLSYGYIDMNNVLTGRKKKFLECPDAPILPDEPLLQDEIDVPKLVFPEAPIHQFVASNGISFKIPYTELYGIGKPLHSKEEYKKANKEWVKTTKNLMKEYHRRLRAWQLSGKRLGLPKPKQPILPPRPDVQKYSETSNIDPVLIASPEQIKEYKDWEEGCRQIQMEHDKAVSFNASRLTKFQKERHHWEEECKRLDRIYKSRLESYHESLVEYPMIFRYFKQATFSSYRWDYQMDPKDLSVLYLAYIIFKLEEKYGNLFSTQIGIPASEKNFSRFKSYASGLLIQAFRLVEDVFGNDFNKFLNTPFEQLLDLIPPFEYSDDLKYQYGIMVLPEAFAALRSVTANGRIPRGMSIMLDVGGGTTDISFFVIEDNGEPHVYHFESIAKGLNYFLEYGHDPSSDFSIKRELEDISQGMFTKAYGEYKIIIDKIVGNLTAFLHSDTISRGFAKRAFTDAIDNRPVVYTGGGCYDSRMRRPVQQFTDVIHIDRRILNIPNVVEEGKINVPYSILATSFGLAISIESDNIQVSKKEELFAKYSKDYDDRWDAHMEHGMYED